MLASLPRLSSRAVSARIDELVFARLEELGIPPAGPCSDAVFLRRIHLDLIGTLPAAAAARVFLADARPDKRVTLVDALLEREEYADFQAMRWCDLLRVKAEFPVNLWPNGVQAYHRWIRDAIRDGLPYDRFARELLTASGSCYRAPAVNFWRAVRGDRPEDRARAVALCFLGERAEAWPPERLAGMAGFFARTGVKLTREWKEEIVYFDLATPAAASATAPDGRVVPLDPEQDPRRAFADWLIRPDNLGFTRCAVNRIWYWLFGRGLVHEPDDFRPDNPPQNPALLDFLAAELPAGGWDPRRLVRAIAGSRAYQLSSVHPGDPAATEANFARYPARPLEAEVLLDALCQLTGTGESYSSAIPEPFTFTPAGQRAIALADGSITSPFLELFGRPPRDTGLAAERSLEASASQRLHLLNSSHVLRKLEQGPGLRGIVRRGGEPRRIVEELYLTILSRFPTEHELGVVGDYLASGVATGPEAASDLAWALINSPEFLYRH